MQGPTPTASSPEEAVRHATTAANPLAAEILEARLLAHRAVLGRLASDQSGGTHLTWLEDRSIPRDGQEDPGAVPALAAATATADEYRRIAEIVRAAQRARPETAMPSSRWSRLAATAVSAGVTGALLCAAALAVLGLLVGGSALQPLNATAHWIYGEQAAAIKGAHVGATGTALFTHLVASLFWGGVLAAILALHRSRSTGTIVMLGVGVGLLALTVDYGLLPESLSPGWHLVLPPWAVLAGFLELGFGLGLGALAVWRR